MPTYAWGCDNCKIQWETKNTFEQHSNIKDTMKCDRCGGKAFQLVSPLNFRLIGETWFGRGAGNNSAGVGYEMTDREMNKSKEDVRRCEDIANNFQEKQ